jgi:bifunctional DNA-binding transcriptional regulator/antitoxin component of YhaV-PrlF toxin-antitoxin module
MTAQHIAAEARVRPKSQLTLPEPIVRAANIGVGDRFVVEVAPDDPDTIRLHRVRRTYAGTLGDVYGDLGEYLEGERAGWDR